MRQDINVGFEKVYRKLDSHHIENINADNLIISGNKYRSLRCCVCKSKSS